MGGWPCAWRPCADRPPGLCPGHHGGPLLLALHPVGRLWAAVTVSGHLGTQAVGAVGLGVGLRVWG